MKSLSEASLQGRKVLLRTDLNLPVEDGEPRSTVRFRRYMETVEQLSETGARTVIMAHQGRPARQDFLSLERHAELVEDHLGQEVDFIRCFFGGDIGEKVSSLEEGGVAVMENVRFLSEELQNADVDTHSNDIFVQRIAPSFDVYVDDAFSAAHRSHGSMVGFVPHLESYPGPVMENELESCLKVRDEVENPLLVLGGEKPDDVIGMMEEMLDRAEKVLLGGIPGELALILKGHDLGGKSEWIASRGFDKGAERLGQLLDEYSDRIEVPVDLETESGSCKPGEVEGEQMTWDIGPETREKYSKEIGDADSVVMKGPMGAFEDYPGGSRSVLEAMSRTEAYSVMGGGHTSSLVQRFGHSLDDFDHVSIAGGAFVRLMSGEELPAVEALKN